MSAAKDRPAALAEPCFTTVGCLLQLTRRSSQREARSRSSTPGCALPGELLAPRVRSGRRQPSPVDRPEQVEVARRSPPGRRSKTSRTALRSCGSSISRCRTSRRGARSGARHRSRTRPGPRNARDPGGDDVLGDPARRVGAGAVHLRRVLARERAAAVARHAAVGVDDDLAPGQAGVAPAARPTTKRPVGLARNCERCRVEVRRGDRARSLLGQVGQEQRLEVDASSCCVEIKTVSSAHRPVVLVDDGHLGLAVGAQV